MKKEYWINVKHVDNRLVVFLNGETIWDSGIVHDDPELNQFINITDQLQIHSSHLNELIFEGFNDSYTSDTSNGDASNSDLNPWHFHYRVFTRTVDGTGNVIEKDMLAPYNEKHMSNPNIRAINNRYQIIRNSEEFKVISNSLSQNFYN
ncbi:MAG: hypothetical protein JWR61_2453 [Ferruginibacter sp.]|jgi:hypothetical protein|uniref:hypothetical protein n=1 Tax=Ferruginibacter sp. TaxID=1940288 RepID=UPI0026594667|nr:hypothetical protein [Ferruginibacter sp.]MDB5277498.1 hypothetical protein [Ferruginibacter sp.]